MRFILPFSATAMLSTPAVPYVDISRLPKLLVSPESLASNQEIDVTLEAIKVDNKPYDKKGNTPRILH